MKQGFLSQYFDAVAAKRLTAVEVNKEISNQHEFNGSSALRAVLGTDDLGGKVSFLARFLFLGDSEEKIASDVTVSWYNARLDKPRAAEWRLFYPRNDVMDKAKEGDSLFVCKRTDGTLLIIILSKYSTNESQLLWLFDVSVQIGKSFIYHEVEKVADKEIDFNVRFILDQIGLEVETGIKDNYDELLNRFEGKLPTTKEFSNLTRTYFNEISAKEDPDAALMHWMNNEEMLFRKIERVDVEKRLNRGFIAAGKVDVDGFISYSLSIQNRRKARAGLALENHLEAIFSAHNIRFARSIETENKSKPDFIFPGRLEYNDSRFPDSGLLMLGVKTTCKDRWRQILSEAKRIQEKHLLTLEPSISENQTNEMEVQKVKLVVPHQIQSTYSSVQQSSILTIREFIEVVKQKQKTFLY